jgi:hypothetical protein
MPLYFQRCFRDPPVNACVTSLSSDTYCFFGSHRYQADLLKYAFGGLPACAFGVLCPTLRSFAPQLCVPAHDNLPSRPENKKSKKKQKINITPTPKQQQKAQHVSCSSLYRE